MLRVIPFPSRIFTPSESDDGLIHLVQEASSLSDERLGDRHLQKLYRDSDDFGFAVRFENTGDVVAYRVYSYEHEPNYAGNTASWQYRPTDESVRRFPSCKDTRVTIFND